MILNQLHTMMYQTKLVAGLKKLYTIFDMDLKSRFEQLLQACSNLISQGGDFYNRFAH